MTSYAPLVLPTPKFAISHLNRFWCSFSQLSNVGRPLSDELVPQFLSSENDPTNHSQRFFKNSDNIESLQKYTLSV